MTVMILYLRKAKGDNACLSLDQTKTKVQIFG